MLATQPELTRILVVDDEPDILRVYERILAPEAEDDLEVRRALTDLEKRLFSAPSKAHDQPTYDVVCCRQGEEAVAAVCHALSEGQPFAVAFVDVRMPPGIDGVETARRIREFDPEIEIIIVTGYAEVAPEEIAEQVPPIDRLLYLQKPLRPIVIRQLAASRTRAWADRKVARDYATNLREINTELTRNLEASDAIADLLDLALRPLALSELLSEALAVLTRISWLRLEDTGAVFLVEGDQLTLVAERNLPSAIRESCATVSMGTCLCGQAAATGQVQFTSHVNERHTINYPSMVPHGHYCVPMLNSSGKVLGVLNLYVQEAHSYDKREERFLRSAANVLGSVVERRQEEYQKLWLARFNEIVLETLPMGVVVLDEAFRICSANTYFCSQVGLDLQQVLGASIFCTLPPALADWLAFRKAIYKSSEEAPQTLPSYDYELPDGQQITIKAQIAGFEVTNGQGRTQRHTLLLIHDISEQARLEEQTRQTSKLEALGTLAGGIAHDFNNLLTGINGYSSMLLSDNLVSEQGRDMAEAIVGLAKRATGLTRQLLAFSRQQPVRPSSLNVNQLVESQTRLLRRLLGEDVELITELDPTIGTTYADEGQIEQVLMNLLVNARDAMPEGGRVTITTAAVKVDENGGELSTEVEPGWYVRLSVSDTGVGMDKATRERIFEPFFSTKPIGKGTGLGLATVYKIVKRHGGHIAVDSTPGKGTSFHVYLPIDDTASALKATYSSTEVPRGDGQTILIVEDEKSVLNVATRALRSQGYNVLSAPGPAEAENLFQQQEDKIDLLLTDVVMPSTSGPQLYKRLVARQPSLKVLYMSGYPQHPADRALELTPDTPFIPKPFTPAELAQQVHAILQGVNVIN